MEPEVSPEMGEDLNDDASAFFANLTGEPQEGKEPTDGDTSADTEDAFATSKDPAETPAPAASDDPDEAEHEWGDEGAKVKAKMRELKDAFRVREESARVATEAAQARLEAVAKATQASTALNSLVAKAAAKWEPFSKLDFLALSKDPAISSEDFTALRAAAQEALTDYRYLTTELEGSQKAAQEAAGAARAAEVAACIKELEDPAKGIQGFGRELFGKLVDHATSTYGAPKDAVLAITAPWAVRVLNDAMLYRQGLQAASQKVQKVVNKPTNVLRPGGSGSSDTSTRAQAMKQLRASHSVDDAADAFLASFGP